MGNEPVIFIKFADSKIPEFKTSKGKGFVMFGENNDYPNYLLYLYNKSSKHNAIINGKVVYVYGKGLTIEGDAKGLELLNKVNSYAETLNDIVYKCIIDVEIFGGAYIKVVYNIGGEIAELYHIPFHKIRVGIDGKYFFKDNWADRFDRTKPIIIDEFNPNAEVKTEQILAYKEYRPDCDYYPLPGYIGSANYIETDVKISQYHLSAITNGMFPSKLIQFFNGEPTEEGKGKLERAFKSKFAGSENAGGIMLMFGNDPAKAVRIDDLSATELDKQFTILNETVQQEVFSGHGITTPSLFGVMTAGKLGETNQLKEGYEIFKKTYVEVKQIQFERFINYLTRYMGVANEYRFVGVDPIGFTLSEAALLQIAPKEWLLEQAGIELSKTTQLPEAPPEQQLSVNENLKNMTGKQMQGLMRIVRKYSKGELTLEQARLMLENSFGLSREQQDIMLGITPDMEDGGNVL
jgi:hypothetical protein